MDVVTERKALNAWRKIGEAQRLIREIVLQGSRPGITQILCDPHTNLVTRGVVHPDRSRTSLTISRHRCGKLKVAAETAA